DPDQAEHRHAEERADRRRADDAADDVGDPVEGRAVAPAVDPVEQRTDRVAEVTQVVPLGEDKRRGQAHRSTSPITMSMLPSETIESATVWPITISRSTERL